MKILQIEDKYNTEIELNDYCVFNVTPTKIQVEKSLLDAYIDNSLFVLYKDSPKLCSVDIEPNKQKVDLPPQLIEVLILGMAVKAYGMGALTNDPRTGSSYVQNPYIDRYELAIKKALDYGYLYEDTLIHYRDISKKGFI